MSTKTKLATAFLLILIVLHQLTIHAGHLHWLLDIWSHMQLQVLIVSVPVLVGLALVSRAIWLVVVGGGYIICLGLWVLLPMVWHEQMPTVPPTVYYQNVQYQQPLDALRKMGDAIASSDADIIALVEPHPVMVDQIRAVRGEDPIMYHHDRGRSCAVFVRDNTFTVQHAHVVLAPTHDPLCIVQFATFDLYIAHPLPPLNADHFARQKAYFATLEAHIVDAIHKERAWLVVGDFNSTSYSALFRQHFGAYVDTRFYTWNWPAPLTIPIDHAFGSFAIDTYLYPAHTSDHRGLGVVFK